AGHHIWRLSEGGGQSLGLFCTPDGLFLGGTALIERRGSAFAVRPPDELARLLGRAYGSGVALERVAPGLATVASALAKSNLPLAQIAALYLRLPDLADPNTRLGVEAEDLL